MRNNHFVPHNPITALRPQLSSFNRELFHLSEFTLSEKLTSAWNTPGPKEARWEKPHFKQLSSSVLAHRYMARLCSWVTIIEPNSFSYSNSSNSVYFLEYLGPAQLSSLNAHNSSRPPMFGIAQICHASVACTCCPFCEITLPRIQSWSLH